MSTGVWPARNQNVASRLLWRQPIKTGVRVIWIYPVHLFRGLCWRNIHIDHDGLLTATRDHAVQHLAWAGIDLLMRHERWHIDKVARSCFRSEFEMLTPAHPCPPRDDVNHRLQFAMMVWARFGLGLDREGAGPQLARTGPCSGNRRRARHIGCLRSIQINLTSRNHLHSVVAPICLRLHTHTNSPLCGDLDECRTPEAQSVLKDTERARCRSASTRDTDTTGVASQDRHQMSDQLH